MKNLSLILIHALFLIALLSTFSYAQNNLELIHDHQGYYMNVDYIQIQQKDILSFENNIEELIKPIQQARIDSDYIKEWYLYRVAFPGSRNTQYNYVVVSISNQICGFEDISNQISVSYLHDDIDEKLVTYFNLMVPNHSELWKINNSVLVSSDSKPSRYFLMDYMNVRSGMEYAYLMMEDELARPLHEIRMKHGNMEGWEIFSLITPGGTEYGYNFAAGNHVNSLRNIEFGFSEELIRQNRPDANVREFFNNVEETRDLVRSELWELVNHVK